MFTLYVTLPDCFLLLILFYNVAVYKEDTIETGSACPGENTEQAL